MRLALSVLTASLLTPVAGSAQVWQPRSDPGLRGVPRMTLPDVSSQEQPTFRTSVVRVGVSALVLDEAGRPVRGLTDADFRVFEDGRPQVLSSFAAFEYDPDSVALDMVQDAGVSGHGTAAPATNAWTAESRLFAVIIDDLHIDARRTERTRQIVRHLIDRLDPSDLLFVGLTGSGETTGAFSRDRRRARELVEAAAGQRLLDPMIELLRSPGTENTEPGAGGANTPGLAASAQQRILHLERAYELIGRLAGAVAHMPARRKTLLFVSEGSPVGATVTAMGELNVGGSANRALQQAMAAASVADLAIYPMNPAGLAVAGEHLIEGRVREQNPSGLYVAHEDNANVMSQFLQARQQLRSMADLTGGLSLIDSNDFEAGIERVLTDASDYYVLSYEPDREVRDSRFRTLDVKVDRPGVTVLARRGYIAPRYLRIGTISVPDGLSAGLQNLLSDIVEEDDLAMKVQVVPLAVRKQKTLAAVIVEVAGAPLVASAEDGKVTLDQAIFSLDGRSRTANATRRRARLSFTPEQLERLDASGVRTVWSVELKPGEHQIRLAAVDERSGRGGSVFVDIHIPEDVPTSGVIVASQALATMPTAFVDKDVREFLSGTPTASRIFPGDDTLEVSVTGLPGAGLVRLESASGVVAWEGRLETADGAVARVDVPLAGVAEGAHRLVIDAPNAPQAVPIMVVPHTQLAAALRQ